MAEPQDNFSEERFRHAWPIHDTPNTPQLRVKGGELIKCHPEVRKPNLRTGSAVARRCAYSGNNAVTVPCDGARIWDVR